MGHFSPNVAKTASWYQSLIKTTGRPAHDRAIGGKTEETNRKSPFLGQLQTFFFAQDKQSGRPGVSRHGISVNHTHRAETDL